MGKYSFYDLKQGIIFTDLTGLKASNETTDEVIDEIIGIARKLPEKVYVVVCWQDAQISGEYVKHYGQRVADLMPYVRGIVRYAANDAHTRINIRTETIKHKLQGSRSNIYDTKEQALAAIRNGEV